MTSVIVGCDEKTYAILYYNSDAVKLQGKAARLPRRNGQSGAGALAWGASEPPVLFSGGDPAADMPLGLIFIQNHFYLPVKARVNPGQPILEILMYGALRDAEGFGGAPDRGLVFDDIQRQVLSPLFNRPFQWQPLHPFGAGRFARLLESMRLAGGI